MAQRVWLVVRKVVDRVAEKIKVVKLPCSFWRLQRRTAKLMTRYLQHSQLLLHFIDFISDT
jgi:hypothetical protein